MEHDHDHEEAEAHKEEHDHDHEVEEHVWTAPTNALLIVKKITSLLKELDPQGAELYEERSGDYMKKLSELDKSFKGMVDASQRRLVVFGDRFPFRYLADAYGLTYYAAFSGCSTETEASAATVAFLVKKVEENKLPAVFTIEFSNGKIADSICDATEAKKLMLHSCHNISSKEFADGVSYLSLMQKNVETLREALN